MNAKLIKRELASLRSQYRDWQAGTAIGWGVPWCAAHMRGRCTRTDPYHEHAEAHATVEVAQDRIREITSRVAELTA